MEIQKEYNLRYLLAKVLLHEEKRRTGSDSGRTNATKTMSDFFRHRSRTGKSYCRTRSDVGSERVKQPSASSLHVKCYEANTTFECGANEPQCCVMFTLPILLNLFFVYLFWHNLQLKLCFSL
jgi:hypothetical protein